MLSGNTEKIEEIKGKILKELGIASGIFLAINGGLAIALRSVIRLLQSLVTKSSSRATEWAPPRSTIQSETASIRDAKVINKRKQSHGSLTTTLRTL